MVVFKWFILMLDFLVFCAVVALCAVLQMVGFLVDEKILTKYGKAKQRQYRRFMIGLVMLCLVITPFFLFDLTSKIQ